MEVQMIARASGPFGELNRKARLSNPQYPRDYLEHLVKIGVAVVTIADKPEPPMEYKQKKSIEPEKTGSSSQVAPVSQKKTLSLRKAKT